MAGIPPLRNIRKTTAILLVVFLVFLIQRTVVFFTKGTVIKNASNTELSLSSGLVCRHIVKETPFGADSIFEEGIRLYFYTTLSSSLKNKSDTLFHIWYHGLDTIQVYPCNMEKDIDACISEIPPNLLTKGEWSVDLVSKRRLLYSKQFFVNETANR